MKKCVFCRKTKGGKRITLINAKFIHEDCHNFLEYRPEAISNQMMYLYQKRDSIINKIFSIFNSDGENSPINIEHKLVSLNHESQKIQNLKYKIYSYWPEYPPDWDDRRREVIEKAEEKCEECGQPEEYMGLHVHHIKFRGRGGSHKISNLIALCEYCHEKKHGGRSFNYNKKSYRPSAYPERIKTINNAIKRKKNLVFNYYKIEQKKWMKRKVNPNKLTKEIWIDGKTKFVLDKLYLVGHCYLRDDRRTFRLDRMKGLKISK